MSDDSFPAVDDEPDNADQQPATSGRQAGDDSTAALEQVRAGNRELRLELEQARSENSKLLAELNELRASRKVHFEAKDQQVQAALDEVFATTSWRLTRPVRYVGQYMRKPLLVLRLYRRARQHYSLWAIVSRSLSIVRTAGPSGLLRMARQYKADAQAPAAPKPTRNVMLFRSDEQSDRRRIRNIDLTAYDGLSLDVFDTAILRLFHKPTDVFRQLERTQGSAGFADWRVRREKEAREQATSSREITLSRIYENDPTLDETETALELAACVANPEIYELYRKALALGKDVVFVSDMYLPAATVERILDQAGYRERKAVFVSSEDQLVKGDGSRFQNLKQSLFKNRFLHVGDNGVADVAKPREYGIDALHYQTPEDFYQKDKLLGSQYPILRQTGSLAIATLLGAYRYWKLGVARTTEVSPWRDVGFFYAGPLLLGFIRSLKKQLDQMESPGGIYFAARDGDILKQIFDQLYGDEGFETHYLYASRRCMSFPLFALPRTTLGDRILDAYAICETGTDVDAIMNRLGYDEIGSLRADLEKQYDKADGLLTPAGVKKAFRANQDAMADVATQERDALHNYLEQVDFGDKRPVFVDVGWSGTTQDAIDILLSQGDSSSVAEGFYVGINPGVKKRAHKHGYLFDSASPALAERCQHSYVEFIELLISSPLDSVKRMALDSQGCAEPAYFEPSAEEKTRQDASREIQRGVMAFCSLARHSDIVLDNLPTPEEMLYLFDTLRVYASGEVVETFDTLSHARLPNGAYNMPILAFSAGHPDGVP